MWDWGNFHTGSLHNSRIASSPSLLSCLFAIMRACRSLFSQSGFYIGSIHTCSLHSFDTNVSLYSHNTMPLDLRHFLHLSYSFPDQLHLQRKACKGNTAVFLLECQRRVFHWLEKPGHGFSDFALLPCGSTFPLFSHQWNSEAVPYPVLMQSKWKLKERAGEWLLTGRSIFTLPK